MRKVGSILRLLCGHMVDWLYSPRTLISGMVVLALAYMNARSYVFQIQNNQLYAYFGETAYYYLSSGFGNITLVSALLLVMMAEVPRRTAYQNMMLIRSNRMHWLLSQWLFCFVVTCLMIVMMLLFSMAMTCPYLASGSGWSDLERIAADPDARWMVQLTPEYVRSISPFVASLIALVILFAFWFTMLLVILFCSLLGRPNLGLILYVFLLVLHITVLWEQLPVWAQTMPAAFSTMAAVANQYPEQELPSMTIVILAYVGLDSALGLWMYFNARRMDLFFTGKDVA